MRRYINTPSGPGRAYNDSDPRPEIRKLNIDWGKAADRAKQLAIHGAFRAAKAFGGNRFDAVRAFLVDIGYPYLNIIDDLYRQCQSLTVDWEGEDSAIILLTQVLRKVEQNDIADVSTMFGKLTVKSTSARAWADKRLRDWLYVEPDLKYPSDDGTWTTEAFNRVFPRALQKCVDKADLQRMPKLTFYAFCHEVALYGTGGAVESDFPGLSQILQLGAVKNKWAAALALTGDQIYELVVTSNPEREKRAHEVFKSEPANVRMVILTDFITYIALSWMCYLVEPMLSAADGFFLLWPEERKRQFWADEVFESSFPGRYHKWKVASDVDQWEARVSHQNIRDCVDVCFGLIRSADYSYYDPILHRVCLEASTRCMIVTKDGKILSTFGRYTTNGMLSGFRITGLFNTMINLGSNVMAEWITGILAEKRVCWGDDIYMVFGDGAAAYKHLGVYDRMGYIINWAKSSVSMDEGEFIKQHVGKGQMSQSPLRQARAVLFGADQSGEDVASEDSPVAERLDAWAALLGRIRGYSKIRGWGTTAALWPRIVRDFHGMFKRTFSFGDVSEFLRTSSIISGGGLADNAAIPLTVKAVDVIEVADNALVNYVTKRWPALVHVNPLAIHKLIARRSRPKEWAFKRVDGIKPFVLPIQPNDLMFVDAAVNTGIPTRRLPSADGSGLLTRAILEISGLRVKDVLEEYAADTMGVLHSDGYRYLASSVVDIEFARVLYASKDRMSLRLLQLWLDGKLTKPPIPRELVARYGDALTRIWWGVVSPFVSMTAYKSSTATGYLTAVGAGVGYICNILGPVAA